MRDLSSTKKGRIAELAITERLLRFGFEVFAPACDDAGVDLVAKIPQGIFIELQIKARIVWRDTDTFIINEFPDDCTFFVACYDLRNKNLFLLPGSVVKSSCQQIGKKGNWYVIPHSFLQQHKQYKNLNGLIHINDYLDSIF